MYDWQDKDGYGKLTKILNKLLKQGYNAEMSNNKMFVMLYDRSGKKQICEAYSSSWHNTGLIEVKIGYGKDFDSTFSADEAYDMMIKIYDEATKINITQILIDHDLPLPGTILYPPLDKIKGDKLLRYEINSEGMFAIVAPNEFLELTWSLDRVKQCTV